MNDSRWVNQSVLIAGCGSIGRRHARVLRELGVEDLRVCDPSSAQIEALTAETPVRATYLDYEEGLRDRPDAVLIGTPPKLHIPMAIQALDAGRHVFSEKPVSDSLDQVDELQQAIDRSGKVFMVGLCFRYHEGLTLAKKYLDEGRIGRLVSIRLRMSENLADVRPDYKSLYTLKQMGVYDLSHEVDLACWFADTPLTDIQAMHGAFSDLGFTAPDIAQLNLRFGDACLASVYLDFFSKPRTRFTELMGTEGTVTVEFADWQQCTVSVYEASSGQWQKQVMPTERDFMFRSEHAEFLQAITNGSPTQCPLSEGVKSLQIISTALA
jgi:predicted dehydrogenase